MVFHFAESGKIFITNTLMQHPFYGGEEWCRGQTWWRTAK